MLSDENGSDGEAAKQAIPEWSLEQGETIIDALRRWAPKIVMMLSEEDAQAEKVQLEGSITWIQTVLKGMQAPERNGRER